MSYLIKCVLVCGIADSSRNQQLAAASSQASKTSNTTTWREDGQKDRSMLSQDSSPRYLIGMYFDFLPSPTLCREGDHGQMFVFSSRAEHESWWRPMRAWMMMRAAVMESGKTHFGPLVLEPIPLYTSAPPRSPVEALAMRMRQSAQQRTMATMASPSPSPLPFIPPHNRPRRPPRIVIPRPSSRLKLPRVTLVTKSIPLTLVSLALVAGIASSAVAIALPSREESSSSAPYDSPPTRHQTIIPPPHQIYDEAMYSDPELQKLMATHHGLGAPDSRFVRDGGEQRRELQERYGYSFWMDGMWVLDG